DPEGLRGAKTAEEPTHPHQEGDWRLARRRRPAVVPFTVIALDGRAEMTGDGHHALDEGRRRVLRENLAVGPVEPPAIGFSAAHPASEVGPDGGVQPQVRARANVFEPFLGGDVAALFGPALTSSDVKVVAHRCITGELWGAVRALWSSPPE